MRIIILSAKMVGLIASLAAVLVWLIAIDGANAKGRSSGTIANHSQNTIHPRVAKNERGHRHHRHELMVGALPERPVYCDCSYESCPEWVLVQCVGYRPRHTAARPVEPLPRCICSGSDLTDPNYD